uniref:KRAB domain-containing protein n=1 Tax=Terrapene triunguis TaxID=2587831 RepID=A0A674I162_9SAUR
MSHASCAIRHCCSFFTEKTLPPRPRVAVYFSYDEWQTELYHDVMEKNYALLTSLSEAQLSSFHCEFRELRCPGPLLESVTPLRIAIGAEGISRGKAVTVIGAEPRILSPREVR